MHRCTLIDPRPQKVSKPQRRWLKTFAASQQHHTDAAQHPDSSSVSCTTEVLPGSSDGQAQTQPAANGLPKPRTAAPTCISEMPLAHQLGTQPPSIAAAQDVASLQASAAERGSPPAQASAAETELRFPDLEQQGGTACNQQPTPHDDAGQLSGPQPSAQHRRPDLRGTLSHQVQVGSQHLLV